MKAIRRSAVIAIVLCILLSLAGYASAAEVVSSNQFEDADGSYVFYDDGTQVISGSGEVGVGWWHYEAQKIIIEDGFTSIANYAFENVGSYVYNKLESISIPGSVIHIKKGAVSCNNSLCEVILHEGLQIIDNSAFCGNVSLGEITIPASVTTIGEDAFNGCNLEKVVFLGAPPAIGTHAFLNYDYYGQVPLTIYYPDNQGWTQADLQWYGTTTKWVPYTMDATGNMIPDESAAYEAKEPEFVPSQSGTFGDNGSWRLDENGVLYIEGSGCLVFEDDVQRNWIDLKGLVIGEGITEIQGEFSGYPNLKSVTFPSTFVYGGFCSFYNCGIAEVNLNEGMWYTPVFNSCRNLKHITLPSTILGITMSSFAGNENLESITFLGDPPATIEYNAFSKGVGEVILYYPAKNYYWDPEELEKAAFGSTSVWTPYTLDSAGNLIPQPENAIRVVGVAAEYDGGNYISTIYSNGEVIVEGTGEVDVLAYDSDWSKATSVVYKEGITEISYGKLTLSHDQPVTVQFPESLDKIGKLEIDNVQHIVFPENVKTIGDKAFVGCDNLERVIFTGKDAPEVQMNSFGDVICYYPEEYADGYSNQDFQSCFAACYPYVQDELGNLVVDSHTRVTEEEVISAITNAQKRFPEGYAIDRYSVSVLNGTGLRGYGSQAFAYVLSDYIFDRQPSRAYDNVKFADVKIGDILRLDNDTCSVVITAKNADSVTVVMGDYNGKVHWGGTLTAAQVEAADYCITRYGAGLESDVSIVKSEAEKLPPLPTTPAANEQEAYNRMIAMKASLPQGLPFTEEIEYTMRGNTSNTNLYPYGHACAAFTYMISDLAFGTSAVRENHTIVYEDIMVGDMIYYDPDPNDDSTHIVIVMEVYSDCVVVAEGNLNEAVSWNRVMTKEDIESDYSMVHYTRYPVGTTHEERVERPEPEISEPETPDTETPEESIPVSVIKTATNTAEGVELTWDPVENADYYAVYVSTADSEWQILDTTRTTSYVHENAITGTAYYYAVEAYDSFGFLISEKETNGKYHVYYAKLTFKQIENTAKGPKLTWDSLENVAYYTVYFKTENFDWVSLGQTSDTYYVHDDAISGTKYYYSVVANDSTGFFEISEKDETGVGNMYYAQPTLKKIENTAKGVKLTWNKVQGASKYEIFVKTGKGEWKSVGTTEKTGYTYTKAKSGTKYYMTVRAMSSSGKTVSTYNTTGKNISFYAQPTLKKIENTAKGVKLTWNKVQGASKYEIFVKTGKGEWKSVGTTTKTGYTYTKAKSGTKYYMTVRAMSSSGKTVSTYNTTGKNISFYAQPTLKKIENTAKGVKLTWNKVQGASKYEIFVKTGKGEWKSVGTTEKTGYTYTKAKSGTKYYFTVRAMSSSGKTLSSYDTTGKSITHYAQPTIKKVTNTEKGVKVTWGKVAGASKYELLVKTGSGSWKSVGTTTKTGMTYTKAKSGTKYYFTVRAMSSSGKTLSSYDTTGKSITHYAQPTIKKVTNTEKGVKVTWSKVTGASKYEVFVKTAKGEWKSIGTTAKTGMTYTKGKSGTKYYFTVRALSSSGKTYSSYDTTGKSIVYKK